MALCDRLKWVGHKEGNLETYARRELELAGWFDKDGFYGDMMGHAVMRMMREFSDEGHSGTSAHISSALFKSLSRFRPLTPLTGADDEWIEVSSGLWQNNRCSTVFKDADGSAYDIDGIVWEDEQGIRFTNKDSRVEVTFPYEPDTEYRKVPA